MQKFLIRFFKRPPIVFPLLALFLLALTIYEMINWWGDYNNVESIFLWRPVILIAYTVCWFGATFLKRWGAVAFILLTIANFSFFLFGKDNTLHTALGDILFPQQTVPLHLFMCVLLLLYFKRMD